MNSREKNHFDDKNIEGFIKQIIMSDLKRFPKRSFGESRKLQSRSNIVNKYMEAEKKT